MSAQLQENGEKFMHSLCCLRTLLIDRKAQNGKIDGPASVLIITHTPSLVYWDIGCTLLGPIIGCTLLCRINSILIFQTHGSIIEDISVNKRAIFLCSSVWKKECLSYLINLGMARHKSSFSPVTSFGNTDSKKSISDFLLFIFQLIMIVNRIVSSKDWNHRGLTVMITVRWFCNLLRSSWTECVCSLLFLNNIIADEIWKIWSKYYVMLYKNMRISHSVYFRKGTWIDWIYLSWDLDKRIFLSS